MAITQVPVHGTVKEADGSIAAGATVSFALKAAITDGTFIVSTEPVVATCDATGAFTQTLYATDDSTTSPSGSYYTVTIQPAGKPWVTIEKFDFVLPHADSAGVDLFALAPLTNPSIVNPYVAQIVAGSGVTLSPAGGTGVVTVTAAGGGGSSSGDLLVAAANPELLVFGTIIRNPTTGVVTSAPVVWPDGTSGTYTPTVNADNAVMSYTITYGAPVATKTYTQPTMTRDSTTGAVTVRPALTVA